MLAIRTLSGAGAELVVETLATGLDPKRFDVTVCELVGVGEKGERLRRLGYEVTSLLPGGNGRGAYANFLRLRRLVAERQIELIHSHSPATLADAALCRCLRPGVKILHTFHFGNYPHLDRSARRLERTFAGFADRMVAVGHGQAATICDTYGWRPERLQVIWNGIHPRPARIDRQSLTSHVPEGHAIIGMVGTLIAQKGHTDMFEVAGRLKKAGVPATFLVVGGGSLQAALEAQCRALGLDETVKFLGWISDAAEAILPGIDIFFQPSRCEAMSMVLLEAAACGLPIVCTDVGEAPRILDRGAEAIMTSPGDVSAMTDALMKLVADPSLRRRLGQAARSKVLSTCTADTMVRQYEHLYLDMLAHRQVTPAAFERPGTRAQGRL